MKSARYWEHRLKTFGPEKWHLPLTLKGAMRYDWDALRVGAKSLLPCKDTFGRAIIYSNRSALTTADGEGNG